MPKLHILLAPSETKSSGGDLPPLSPNSFIFEPLYPQREALIQKYKEMIGRKETQELQKKFGIKKMSEIESYLIDITATPTKKAIERYTGVAFDYLDYPSLDSDAKAYIDDQVLLFSNLFGPVRAKDHLPYYKLKQGEKLDGIAIDRYYKEHFSDALDTVLEGDVIDLRAGVYEKFYKISKPYTTFKFLKEGKVVSHWAKAYRGKLLRVLAEKSITQIEDLKDALPETMHLDEIKKSGNKEEWIISIRD